MERDGENRKEKGEGRRRAEGRGRQPLAEGGRHSSTPSPFG